MRALYRLRVYEIYTFVTRTLPSNSSLLHAYVHFLTMLLPSSRPNQVTIKKDMADDPSRNVICRCELVTEAEVH
jgi:hypothetical protein